MRKQNIVKAVLLIAAAVLLCSSCGSKPEILPEPVSADEQISMSLAAEEPVAEEPVSQLPEEISDESEPAAEEPVSEATGSSEVQQVQEIPQERAPAAEEPLPEEAPAPEQPEEEGPAESFEGYDSVDLDLTVMSPTMIYSNVYNMMMTPEDYFDKVIKVEGMYAYYFDEETQKMYYAVIIPDATACCQQGVEFILADETAYPESAETVTVTGVLSSYEENGFKYLVLADAVLET